MEKYINMEESLNEKLSVSSTKSFQTSYEECIQNLKEQVENHKKALLMAQTLLEHYKKENKQLRHQIQRLKQQRNHTEQKYGVLQKLFLKFDRQKEREITKEMRKSQEKHFLQLKAMNSRHQSQLQTLKQKVFILENQLKKYSQKQKEWKQFQIILDREIHQDYIQIQKKHRQNCIYESKKIKCRDSNENSCQTGGNSETLKKIDNFLQKKSQRERNKAETIGIQYKIQENYNRTNLRKKGQSLANKDKRGFNANDFMVMTAHDDYDSVKQDIFRTAQKPNKPKTTGGNFLTEYKTTK